MNIFFTSFLYVFLFIILYFEVFLILTLVEHRKGIKIPNIAKASFDPLNSEHVPEKYPSVTIVVPILNEEKTVSKTVNSLLDLNYPKEKLSVMVIDDGSTDNTWNIVQQFSENPQVMLHKKENGGKYTAINYAIERCASEFIGCLDADSFVDKDALLHIIPHFEDAQVMAVTPSLKIQNPNNMLRMMQNAEYNLGIFIRKILGILDAQYVTPGPFSIFRKEVFNKVGLYKHAHNTEDLEMALRLQEHHYKILNAHKALVYTVGPPTVYKLYKQRVRWTGGFLQNTLDYKRLLFNPRYGNFGILILPVTLISMLGSFILLFYSLFLTSESIIKTIHKFKIVGMHGMQFSWNILPSLSSYDWWLYHVQATALFSLLSTGIVIFSIWYGRKISGGKDKYVLDFVYFLFLYSLIAPFWLVASVYNTIRNRDASWR